ncbi:MAG: PilZ domain-containing protein, partial [Sandaracinaceae bacterium]
MRSERRADEAPRVPLDLSVRLHHEDFDAAFDADSVDVSTRGLSLRAGFLPDVGDRLRCRFSCPHTGEALSVRAEVVWTQGSGPRRGEFGISFADLDPRAEESLRSLIETVREAIEDTPPPPSVRLHLDGVLTPIEGELVLRNANGFWVEQELPFLRLGMGVAVEGGLLSGRGTLAGVDLQVEGGVPRLLLQVRAPAPGRPDTAEEADRPEDGVESESTLRDVEAPAAARDAFREELAADVREVDGDVRDDDEADEDAPTQPRMAGASRARPAVQLPIDLEPDRDFADRDRDREFADREFADRDFADLDFGEHLEGSLGQRLRAAFAGHAAAVAAGLAALRTRAAPTLRATAAALGAALRGLRARIG